jgi:hypothetical protein
MISSTVLTSAPFGEKETHSPSDLGVTDERLKILDPATNHMGNRVSPAPPTAHGTTSCHFQWLLLLLLLLKVPLALQ